MTNSIDFHTASFDDMDAYMSKNRLNIIDPNTIRKDQASGKFSVIDIIKAATGFDSSNSSTYLARLCKDKPELGFDTRCSYIRINGKGRETPVADLATLVEIVWELPGKTAQKFRRQSAKYIVRILGGDPSLVDEIIRQDTVLNETEEGRDFQQSALGGSSANSSSLDDFNRLAQQQHLPQVAHLMGMMMDQYKLNFLESLDVPDRIVKQHRTSLQQRAIRAVETPTSFLSRRAPVESLSNQPDCQEMFAEQWLDTKHPGWTRLMVEYANGENYLTENMFGRMVATLFKIRHPGGKCKELPRTVHASTARDLRNTVKVYAPSDQDLFEIAYHFATSGKTVSFINKILKDPEQGKKFVDIIRNNPDQAFEFIEVLVC